MAKHQWQHKTARKRKSMGSKCNSAKVSKMEDKHQQSILFKNKNVKAPEFKSQ